MTRGLFITLLAIAGLIAAFTYIVLGFQKNTVAEQQVCSHYSMATVFVRGDSFCVDRKTRQVYYFGETR